MRRGWVGAGLMSVLVSCSSSPTAPSVEPLREFVLEVGHAAQVSGTGLRVQFERVLSDSRCPADAFCIQAGDAEVAVTVTRGGHSMETLSLRTDGAESRAALGDWVLSLTKLDPYPQSGRSILPDDYKASFRVDSRAVPVGP
jgi:hypothetical protein